MRTHAGFFAGCLISGMIAHAGIAADARYYDAGNPGPFVDLYLSPSGNDGSSGTSRSTPLRTIGGAWSRIPSGTLSSSGYRLNLLAGVYPFSQCAAGCENYFSDRSGTFEHPIIMQPADGPGTVTIRGGLNLARIRYLYMYDLILEAGGSDRFDNNVLHIDGCDHLLLHGLTVRGLVRSQFQEVIKANQAQYLYIEDSDISGTFQCAIDYFAIQHGHILNSRIHASDDWAAYLKGGSAYLRIEGNEFYDTRLGFSAGEGSNFEVFVSPWLHYEAYDIKFVNNVMHDVAGVAISASGGYNILFAHNTFYRVAYDARGYGLVSFAHGARGCWDFDPPDAGAACGRYGTAGGWGPPSCCGSSGEYIPNRNVSVYNNIFYNPAGLRTAWSHFDIHGPVTPPAGWNLPNPSAADDGVRIRGNVIWNGPADHPVGVGDGTGCQDSSSSCTETQIRNDNSINSFEPQLIDPAHGNFRPVPGGNIAGALSYPIADFTWSDAPSRPAVPAGNLSNRVTWDHDGNPRSATGSVGAYETGGGSPTTSADLALVMRVSPEVGAVGSTLTYSLDVRNNGSDEATGVQLSDAFPSELSLVSAVPSQGSCSGGASIDCDLGSMPDGASATVEIQAVTLFGGTILNRASVRSQQTDPVPSNNTASAAATITGGTSTWRLGVRVVGRGTVTSDPGGINCPSDCEENLPAGGTVTLAAVPVRGHRFTGWRGACRGAGPCRVTMTGTRQVTARFRRSKS